jgi:hypothetical protein
MLQINLIKSIHGTLVLCFKCSGDLDLSKGVLVVIHPDLIFWDLPSPTPLNSVASSGISSAVWGSVTGFHELSSDSTKHSSPSSRIPISYTEAEATFGLPSPLWRKTVDEEDISTTHSLDLEPHLSSRWDYGDCCRFSDLHSAQVSLSLREVNILL